MDPAREQARNTGDASPILAGSLRIKPDISRFIPRYSWLVVVLLLTLFSVESDAAERLMGPVYRIAIPQTVLTDVPVQFVRIERLDRDGNIDRSFQTKTDDGESKVTEKRDTKPLITGVLFTKRDTNSGVDVEKSLYAQGGFHNGVLELKTNLRSGEKVYINADEIVVDPDSRPNRESLSVRRINRWWSLLPPFLATGLAIALRNVLVALFAAIWSGAIVLSQWNVFAGFARTLDTYIIGEVGQQSDSGVYDHLLIILFTLFLGAMIGVMGRSGGTTAIVRKLGRLTRTREHGQILTWILGFAVFFDDYANTLLVGGTMRPVTDRLKISREKLAFIVDSTAAPVAGLAIVSTWVGVEVGLIQSSYAQLFTGAEPEWNAYSVFLATLPYRFYPLLMLVFVLLVAYSGNDFGPMLRAEARAVRYGHLGATDADEAKATDPATVEKHLLRNAIIPLIVLMTIIVGGMWKTGTTGLDAQNEKIRAENQAALGEVKPVTTASTESGDSTKPPEQIPEESTTLANILKYSDSTRVMFFSAFMASVSGILSAIFFRCLSLNEAVEAWIAGAKSMFPALLILIMAWAVATICNSHHLNTAGFLVEVAGGRVSAAWVPALAFLLSAAVSFATGSSYATMGLLMPLFINMTYFLLVNENDANPTHNLLLGSIGAVLAGSIFGDHCSPISDTTVLSSASTGCDHLRHVATQLPYAVVVAGISLAVGYIPVGLGFSPLIMLPVGMIVMYLIVVFIGHPVAEYAEKLPDKPAVLSSKKPSDDAEDQDLPDKEATDAKERVQQADIEDLDVDWDTLPE